MYDSFVISTLMCVSMLLAATAGELAKGKRVIMPFDFHGVELTGGRLRMQFDEVRDYYLKIPLDDLLHGYRPEQTR